MPPEQALGHGQEVDARSDVFALAAARGGRHLADDADASPEAPAPDAPQPQRTLR